MGYVAAVVRDLSGPPLGYAFILLVCVVWVGGSFLVESLEAAGLSPLLLTYVCNALFVVLLPVYYARRRVLGKTTPETAGGDDAARDGAESRESRFASRGRGDAGGNGAENFAYEQPVSGEDEADDYGTALLDVPEGGDVRTEHGDVEGDASRLRLGEGFDAAAARRRNRGARGLNTHTATFAGYTEAERFEYTARAALGIAPLWFAAQLAFNYSLLYTSVTSNSILSTSSAIFTFGLSVYLVNERYSKERVLAILVYMLGSALVTLADSAREAGEPSLIPTDAPSGAGSISGGSSGSDVVIESGDVSKPRVAFGNALCVIAAALYAGYTAAIRWALPDDPETSMLLFLGLLGLVNLLGVGLIVLVGATFFGAFRDVFAECTASAFALVVAKGLVDNVLSDYLWARAVLLTSPTTASVGLSMQIPLAAVTEVLLGHANWLKNASSAAAMLVGCGFVVSGFLGVVYY